MSLRTFLRDWLLGDTALTPVPEAATPAPLAARKRVKINDDLMIASRRRPGAVNPVNPFEVLKTLHPPGVATDVVMAMDDGLQNDQINAWAFGQINSLLDDGQAFMGYPLLAELAQRPEYRRISETIARHMTRKWIDFKVKGDDEPHLEGEGEADEPDAVESTDEDEEPTQAADFAPPAANEAADPSAAVPETEAEEAAPDPQAEAKKLLAKEKSDKVSRIEELLEEIGAKTAFQRIAEQDGFFGRAHLYIDTGDTANPDELKTDIGNGNDPISEAKLKGKKGVIKQLKTVEAVWCYPTNYNSNDPLSDDWYKPSQWFVMGKQVNASRLLTFIGREVPDILKPAYSFGGLSMSQMVRPYVENWLNTRQSVADIISAFSQFVLKTKLTDALQEQGDELFKRAEFFNNMRDNRGLMLIDKDDEDFANVAAPLGSLDKLQAQAQEQMASIAGIPIVLLLMITPSGLNASSEGEIQAFWDWVNSYQESFFRPHLTTIINMIQITEFGEVDPDISFQFARLEGLNDLEWSQKQLNDANRDAAYVNAGIVDVVEVRKVIASDPESPYHGIDADDVPLPPPGEGMMPGFGADPDDPDAEPGDEPGKAPPFGKPAKLGVPAAAAE